MTTYGEQKFGLHCQELADFLSVTYVYTESGGMSAKVRQWMNRGIQRVANGVYRDGRGVVRSVLWTPLVKALTVATAAADESYDLPADLAEILTSLGIATTGLKVDCATLDYINAAKSINATMTGYPSRYALRWNATTSRYELVLWPTPAAIYSLAGYYRIKLPDYADVDGTGDTIALPGEFHEVLQSAAAAVAVSRHERAGMGGEQKEFDEFMERLAKTWAWIAPRQAHLNRELLTPDEAIPERLPIQPYEP